MLLGFIVFVCLFSFLFFLFWEPVIEHLSALHWLPPSAAWLKLSPAQEGWFIEAKPSVVFVCTCYIKSMHVQTRKSDPAPEVRPDLGACMGQPPQHNSRLSGSSLKSEEVQSQAFCQQRWACRWWQGHESGNARGLSFDDVRFWASCPGSVPARAWREGRDPASPFCLLECSSPNVTVMCPQALVRPAPPDSEACWDHQMDSIRNITVAQRERPKSPVSVLLSGLSPHLLPGSHGCPHGLCREHGEPVTMTPELTPSCVRWLWVLLWA